MIVVLIPAADLSLNIVSLGGAIALLGYRPCPKNHSHLSATPNNVPLNLAQDKLISKFNHQLHYRSQNTHNQGTQDFVRLPT
ncbi:MAG: hypothetical protein O4751_01560 [Trichodesmium sp. St2_bin6]|nr:hypothetical protein [Trichodesmium sp. St4_bin8_1]MDE5072595.1 hypothetical protein [Trichodesmium sp. St5_bin8]MDE5077007.1 hypothetical protein [Trichodesmium sp. St2_bin6]MDE5091347.1 hypothetical protein [Trichodesmium sp. St18_bin3_1_1]MDE5101788.1 hypothetical protein [Trichodesmium sp. St19_bin2]